MRRWSGQFHARARPAGLPLASGKWPVRPSAESRGGPRDGATAFPGGCGWWPSPEEEPPLRPPLAGDRRCDVAIVGAGYTGLAAAARLAAARPDWEIVVLDELRVGEGPSGRNSGFVLDFAHAPRNPGSERHRTLVELARHGQRLLAERVRRHGIECHWNESSRYHVAAGPAAVGKLVRHRGAVEALGVRCWPLTRAELAERLGTEYYHSGLAVPGGVLVQPARLVQGLAASLPHNVVIHERTRVHAIVAGRPHRVETPGGGLIADHVVVGVNGASPRLGLFARRVLPLWAFVSLTRRLSDEEQGRLSGEPEWGVVPVDRMGTTVRRTRDGRLLIRNTVRYTGDADCDDSALAAARTMHRASLDARFRHIGHVPLEFTWGCRIGGTLNNVHCLDSPAPGLHAAAGYNGLGIATGTALGTLVAERILGLDSPLLAAVSALPGAPWMPGGILLRLGFLAISGLMQLRAGPERL